MPAPNWIRLLLWLIGVAAGLYGLIVALLYCFQSALIYHPARGAEPELIDLAHGLNLAPWRSRQGEIIGWQAASPRGLPSGRPAYRLLVFHGNAGFALDRDQILRGFEQLNHGFTWEVFLFEYPGYGSRPGQPGEAAITQAAAAFAELQAADDRPIYLLGESLGSGPACALARAHGSEIAGLMLITPFSRLADAADYHYPWLPVRLLLRDRWDNLAALRGFHGRFACLLAGNDQTTPTAEGRSLFASVSSPKQLWVQPNATHNTINYSFSAAWWREASDFLTGR